MDIIIMAVNEIYTFETAKIVKSLLDRKPMFSGKFNNENNRDNTQKGQS